jgi:hypothetical protein
MSSRLCYRERLLDRPQAMGSKLGTNRLHLDETRSKHVQHQRLRSECPISKKRVPKKPNTAYHPTQNALYEEASISNLLYAPATLDHALKRQPTTPPLWKGGPSSKIKNQAHQLRKQLFDFFHKMCPAF